MFDLEPDWQDLYANFGYILKIAGIIAGGFALNFLLRTILNRYLKRESARINVDPTTYNFLKNATSFVIFLVSGLCIIYNIPSFKDLAITLFAGAGIIAAIIGFASQTAFSNIINGIMIVAFKPFRIGDWIEIGNRTDYVGAVEDITLRHTVLRNAENKRVIVPNSVISTEIIVNRNIVDERAMRYVDIGISYSADIDKAIALIREEAMVHPLLIDNRTEEEKDTGVPKVIIRVMELGDVAVRIRANTWANNSADSSQLKADLLRSIKYRFDKEGIEIPFTVPNRTMKSQNSASDGQDESI